MIEEGRRIRPKMARVDRLCKHCNKEVIEDEVHFLLSCENYKDERIMLLGKIALFYPHFNAIPDDKSKFIFLMIQENIEITKMIVLFIQKSFQIRCFV